MKATKLIALSLALCLVTGLAGCAQDLPAVYVQNVGKLMDQGGYMPGDRFAGIVVSEDTTQIEKDPEMTVEELLVKAGDDVKEGQALFTYDTQQLQLSVDKQKLERDQLEASIDNYGRQITELEKERNSATEKLEYTLQIQSLQLDLKEAQINLKAKEEADAAKAREREALAAQKQKEREALAEQKKKEAEAKKKEKAAERRQAQIERMLINTGAQILKRGLMNTLFK